jgi:large repetitive protein
MRQLSIMILGMICEFCVVVSCSTAVGALAYSGGTYSQNFDTLHLDPYTNTVANNKGPIALSTGFTISDLDGWYGANPGGTGTGTEFKAQDGSLASSAGRGVISFGTNGSSERALGVLSTSAQVNSFGLVLKNTSGQTIDAATLFFVGEQWRRGDILDPNPHDTLLFDYLVSSDAGANIYPTGSFTFTAVSDLNFTSPNTTAGINTALDGNAAANRTSLSKTLTGLNWAADSYLVLRWTGQDLSGQDDGLSIDNVSFTSVPEPGTLVLLGTSFAAMAVTFLRRKAGK